MASGEPPYPKMPVLEMPMAVVTLVVNILVPGIGTIVAGVVGARPLIGRGIAQLLLAIIIVGWVWALVNGIQAIANATWKEKRAKGTA
jgi:hypothetical protein